MRARFIRISACLLILLSVGMTYSAAQQRGLKAISASDMKTYLRFLGSREFRGRSAPSFELDIASKYIALEAERIGLKPLLPNGSFFQDVPVEVATISPAKSYLRLIGESGEQKFYFPHSFTLNPRSAGGEWAAAGGLVFVGSALTARDSKIDLLSGVDLKGKFAVLLDEPPPTSYIQRVGAQTRQFARVRLLREKGAIGLIFIISRESEDGLVKKGIPFDYTERLKFLDVDTVNPTPPSTGQQPSTQPATQTSAGAPFHIVEVRHDLGAILLGITKAELLGLFEALSQNQTVAPKILDNKMCEIAVFFDLRRTTTPNVVAWLPGSDARLKNEYIAIGSHHDHNPPREGRIFPGADDNASGAVAMLALAKALMVERPKRSVIFVWHTAEERGLIGAYYFVQHCPVPAEKISANLNLDMITRNDPNGIYLIGSNKLSTELDKSIQAMNAKRIGLKLDYKYEDPGHPDRFFFRSDQYPYIRYGIPGVWFFCGTTEDYHQETDVEEKADYQKMTKVTKLVYLVTLDIGNKPSLLKLDLHPEVTSRGPHNMKVVWQRPPSPSQERR